MPPNNEPASQSPDLSQYDFIMSAGNGHPKTKIINNNSLQSRLLIVLGGGIGLILFVWLFITIASSGGSTNTKTLMSIAQDQTELARISSTPAQSATQQPTKNFAITAQLSLLTGQQRIVSFLKKQGINPDPKTLSATQSTETDATLQAALANDTYDQTYISIAQTHLTSYEQVLKSAFANSKSTSEKQLLRDAYNNAELLLKQSQEH